METKSATKSIAEFISDIRNMFVLVAAVKQNTRRGKKEEILSQKMNNLTDQNQTTADTKQVIWK